MIGIGYTYKKGVSANSDALCKVLRSRILNSQQQQSGQNSNISLSKGSLEGSQFQVLIYSRYFLQALTAIPPTDTVIRFETGTFPFNLKYTT